MFDRRGLVVRRAAVVLVAMQLSLAFYGNAQADDANAYLAEIRAELTEVHRADISEQFDLQTEAALLHLNADARARLATHIRVSTRELLATAAPSDTTTTKPLRIAHTFSE